MNKMRILVLLAIISMAFAPLQKPDQPTVADSNEGGDPLGTSFKMSFESINVSNPAVAYDSQHNYYSVIWQTNPSCSWPLLGRTVTPEVKYSNLLGNFGYATNPHYNADLAYNPSHDAELIVWEEEVNSYHKIYASSGHPPPENYNQAEFPLGTGPALRNHFKPAVAYSTGSDKYLVVWESMVVGALSSDIEAVVVNGASYREGGSFLIATGDNNYDHTEPDVAYLSATNEYLVVWTRQEKATGVHNIVARRVSPTGDIVDANPIVISNPSDDDTSPAVAAITYSWFVGSYAVVWERHYSASDHDIYVRVVSGSGGLNPIVSVETDKANQTQPAIAGNEKSHIFLATWTQPYLGANQGIYARPLSTSGAAAGQAEFIGGLFADHSTVSSGPMGDFLVAYDDTPFFGNTDIWARFWGYRQYLPMVVR